jgi:4-amino-4-deoxy-L-arabinose transferase-like glycosyltransferase
MGMTDYATSHTRQPCSWPHKKKVSKGASVLLAIVTISAILLRIGYVYFTVIEDPIRADAAHYVSYARNLVHHGTFSRDYQCAVPRPDSYRSPGYPAFIASAMLLGGKNAYPMIRYTQAIIGGLMVPVTFSLGVLFLPAWAAMVAAVFVALSPHLVTSTSYVLTETLFGFVFLLALWLFLNAVRRRADFLFAASGASFGYAYLINETALLIPFILMGITLVSDGRGYRRLLQCPFLRGTAWFLVVFGLFPIGWAIRNKIYVSPRATQGKQRALMTLTHGTYPGFVYKDPAYKYYPYKEDPKQPAYSASFSNFATIFWERFRQRPTRYLSWYFIEKPYYVWSWDILQGQGDVYIYPVTQSLYHRMPTANASRQLMKHLHPIILLLALFAFPLFYLQHRRKSLGLSVTDTPILHLVTLMVFTFIHTVFFSLPRYSIPFRPELYLCSLWTVSVLVRSGQTRFKRIYDRE